MRKKARYYIYRNLNKGLTFSVKHKGKVIYRGENILARNVNFKVSEAGRQRCLTEKKRNVHAYAVCDEYEIEPKLYVLPATPSVTYNPYKNSHFQYQYHVGRIDSFYWSAAAFFCNGKCYVEFQY